MNKTLLTAALTMGLAMAAQAGLIDLGYVNMNDPLSVNPITASDPDSERGWLIDNGFLSSSATFLDKWTRDGAVWADTFNQPDVLTAVENSGPKTATLTWDLTGTGKLMALITVKGNAQNYHIYGINSVAPDDETLTSTAVTVAFVAGTQPKNISHVSFWGTPGTGTGSTPDGGSAMAMLGLAITGLGFFARRK